MQTYLNRLACESFDKNFSKGYFSTFFIIKGFFIAFSLSIFIYLDCFSLHVKIIDTIFAIVGFYTLLTCSKRTLPWVGFFIGFFWFYWISFSFRYYDLSFLIPFVMIGFGFIYGFIFWVIAKLSKSVEIRAFLLFGLSFFAPFGFNWFKPELVLINSYFSTNLYMYAVFLTLLVISSRLNGLKKLIPISLLFLLPFLNTHKNPILPKLNIALANTNLNQEIKWDKRYKDEIVRGNFHIISEAIKAKKELVVLSESAFPMYLNMEDSIMDDLKILSFQIPIITGGLRVKNNKVYNSSYFFNKGEVQIANKVVLVPFGEKIPLPKFIVDFINKTFFGGASDYESAKEPFDFILSGYEFRNAICFEATTDELFKDNPKFMIAISNNAWFKPSIEPTLQKLLLKLYAKRYNTVIYHSANGGINGVIVP